ncbi:homoserine kinase [Sinomicrobium weinanense]|uniref:Homoserine kinase n=1 Tax=Sinomicrobium weinanense TaxID=2842200 RepID=A0A926Q4A8_9FLAO|nr:homoserine kinase [Sinomicrobium weinanense]MBC9798397.1 homoserine kinase [Sinomicrobium weinanense]MBU3122588.1 homoserine kinase [Sinomicrobium weinanense]
MNEIRIFCPATIANVSCGFDVLGLCLDKVGDEMVIRKTGNNQVTISKIEGQDLPLDTEKNVAGVSALALLDHLGSTQGFDIEIYKKIKPGSGIGSSAASAAGAVFGINKLLGEPLSARELIPFAMEGEKLASGSWHADNVAPALLGGFSLVRSYEPLDVIKLHTPGELYASIIHPQIEVKTADARSVLKHSVPLKKAIQQWGNVGGLISGLYTEDYDLISRSLHDGIIEPLRSLLIPRFSLVKGAALEAGALGSGISGSGPSIFALSRGEDTAQKVAEAMAGGYAGSGVDFDIHISGINPDGMRVLQ